MKNKDKITKIIVWSVISLLTILTGILFFVQTQRLYRTPVDGDIYSRTRVGEFLKQIIIPIVLWIVCVVVSIIISLFKHLDDNSKSKNANITKLKTLLAIIPFDKINDTDPDLLDYKKTVRNKKIAYAIFLSICAILAIFPCMYLFNRTHYVQGVEATEEVVKAAKHIWPFVLVGFICFIILTVYESYNANNAIISCKKLLKNYKRGPINFKEETLRKTRLMWALRGIIIIIAVVFIIDGISNGGPSRVYAKAAKICTECIGLG